MPSISDSIPFVPAYQPAGKHPIDNDVPRTNPLDKQAGEDAEVSNGKGGWKTHGSATRDHANRTRLDRNFLPSNKKIVDDSRVSSKGQYHRSGTRPVFPEDFHAPTKAPSHGSGTLPAFPAPADNPFYFLATATEVWHPNSRTQPPSPPSDYKALDDSPSNDHREPIDFEIKPDGNGGWTKG